MNDVLAVVREMTAAGIAPGESTYFAVMLVCRNVDSMGFERAVEVYDAMRSTASRFPAARRRRRRVRDSRQTRRRRPPRERRRRRRGRSHRPQTDDVPASLRGGRGRRSQTRRQAPSDSHLSRLRGDARGRRRPAPAAFAALVSAAKRARQPDLVARTFEEMVATGVTPSRGTYEDALSAVSAGGLADVALDVFAAMRRDGFDARKSTYNSLLEACAAAPQPGWSRRSRFFTA